MGKDIQLIVTTSYTYADGKVSKNVHTATKSELLQDLDSLSKKGYTFKTTIHHLDGTITGKEMKVNQRNPATFQVVQVDFTSQRKEVNHG